MTGRSETESAFKNRCANAERMLASLTGYSISRISFEAFNEDDSMEITMRDGPTKPDVVISLSDLRYVAVSKPPEISGCFIDAISLTHLPEMPHPWPEDAAGRVGRFNGLNELAWLRISGPAEVDVVASILTVYTAMSDDEAEQISTPS
ncbi:hypothetical protein [Streptomyces sp. NBC_01443]|uniref:hypothetical protein n=1 Tax=Streptomyces sp. NBC_01443 TaxID=2903868 RepID=UPI002256256B|nr:hypothetical protein [Streptomyces sp. NBC_01443]MCX4632310.1 hypothetical protein [Streptomyces sp. NBC_01443]